MQVIAVEEKGKWGLPMIDYNRGPIASFTTTLKYYFDGDVIKMMVVTMVTIVMLNSGISEMGLK